MLVVAGKIVSRGRSRQNQVRSQLAHAELEALQRAGDSLWERYSEAVLFTTVEPCPLCLDAVVVADVRHVVYGVHDSLAQTRRLIEGSPYVARHIETYCGGLLEPESRALIERYNQAYGASLQPYSASLKWGSSLERARYLERGIDARPDRHYNETRGRGWLRRPSVTGTADGPAPPKHFADGAFPLAQLFASEHGGNHVSPVSPLLRMGETMFPPWTPFFYRSPRPASVSLPAGKAGLRRRITVLKEVFSFR